MSPARQRSAATALFFVFCLALGLAWALIHPPYGISDEPAHAVKAVATASGQLRGPEVTGQFDYNAMEYRVPESYASVWNMACYDIDTSQTPVCALPLGSSRSITEVASTAAFAPPFYYGLVGWVGRILVGDFGVYAMRAVTSFLVASLMAAAYWVALGTRRPPLLVAAIFLAFTPQVAAFAGAVNPQSAEIAAAVLFWVSGVTLAGGLLEQSASRRAARWLFAIASLVFASMKPISAVWMIASLALILLAYITPSQWRSLWHDPARRFVVLWGSAGVLASGLWYGIFSGGAEFGGDGFVAQSFWQGVRYSFEESDDYFLHMFGHFGWTAFTPPVVVPLLFVGGAVLLALGAGRERTRWQSGILIAFALGIALAPTVLEGVRAQSAGFGYQGRYLLGVAVGFPILAAMLGASGVSGSWERATARWIVGAAVAGNLIAANHAARRFFHGLDGPYLWLIDPLWAPPRGAWLPALLLLVSLAAAVGAWRWTPSGVNETTEGISTTDVVLIADNRP